MKSCIKDVKTPCCETYPRLMKSKATGNVWLVTKSDGRYTTATLVSVVAFNNTHPAPYTLGVYLNSIFTNELEDFNGEVVLSN